LEDLRQLLGVDRHAAIARRDRARQSKHAALERLVEDAESTLVPPKQLEPIALAIDEHEERAALRIVTEVLARERRQPVERAAHVDRLRRREDRHASRDHRSLPPSALTSRRSVSRSNPGSTRTR